MIIALISANDYIVSFCLVLVNNFISFFSASVPKTTSQLGSSYASLYSEIAGSPPLWITHVTGRYHDDIYVNNARILVSQSNIQAGGNQVRQHKLLFLIKTFSFKIFIFEFRITQHVMKILIWCFYNNHVTISAFILRFQQSQ